MSGSWRFAVVALAAAGVGAGGTAMADGYGGGSIKDVPVAPVVYDWSGLYVGGHVGWGWSSIDTELIHPHALVHTLEFLGAPLASSQDVDGWLAGGHIGLQHQFGRWVLGVEASFTGGDVDGTSSTGFSGMAGNWLANAEWEGEASTRTKISQLFTATGRLGYAWERWMGYVKGGYASAEVGVHSDVAGEGRACIFMLGCRDFGFAASSSSSKRHDGWTVGAGFEYMLRPDVILGLEYNYIDLGARGHSGSGEAYFDIGPHEMDGGIYTKTRVDPDAIHAVYARLSFKLGREAPAAPLK